MFDRDEWLVQTSLRHAALTESRNTEILLEKTEEDTRVTTFSQTVDTEGEREGMSLQIIHFSSRVHNGVLIHKVSFNGII